MIAKTPPDLEHEVAEAVAAVRKATPLVPRVAITLGSGLGGAVDALSDVTVLETASIPHWPRSTVVGHVGRLGLGVWSGIPVVALAGRTHRYEGYPLHRVTFAVRVMASLGARVMLFTNAVGGINPAYRPGDLMLATDHINFVGKDDMFTPAEIVEWRAGRKVKTLYSPRLREALLGAADRIQVPLHRGVLFATHGPSYETAAEVRMSRGLGGDVVCMSTVNEVTVAAHLGCEAACISCVTNMATGLSDQPLSHDEVTEVADRVAHRLVAVLGEFLKSMTNDPGTP